MTFKKPPIHVPAKASPLVDPATGLITEAWWGFFEDLTSKATPFQAVTVGASPFTYTCIHPGAALIIGGTFTSIKMVRGRVTITQTAALSTFWPLSQGDQLVLTYTVAPTAMWFIPIGQPA